MQEDLLDLIQEELHAYRQTGRAVHLAHAARALNEAVAAMADRKPGDGNEATRGQRHVSG